MTPVSFRFAIMQELQRRLVTLDANGKWGDEADESNLVFGPSVEEGGSRAVDSCVCICRRLDHWDLSMGTVLAIGDDAGRLPVLGGQTQALLVNRNPASRYVDGMDLGPVDTRSGQSEWPIRFDWYARTDSESYDALWHLQRFIARERAKRDDPNGVLGFGKQRPCINGLEFSRGVIPPRENEHAGWTGWLNAVFTLVEDFECPYPPPEQE